MNVNVYLCFVDLVVGDYWMRYCWKGSYSIYYTLQDVIFTGCYSVIRSTDTLLYLLLVVYSFLSICTHYF